MVRHILIGAALLTVAACARHRLPGRSPDLARRADSLQALNPEVELQNALARHDERFIGVCSIACLPVGLSSEQIGRYPMELNIVQGTTDAPKDEDAMRLDRVADHYADRYNRLLVAHLDSAGHRRP
jgi:hypothetical protein